MPPYTDFPSRSEGRQGRQGRPERLAAASRAAWSDLGPLRVRLVSAVAWRNRPGWSLERRRINDQMLLVPTQGRLAWCTDTGEGVCAPGQGLLIGAGAWHALRALDGRGIHHLIVHAFIHDQHGLPLADRLASPCFALDDQASWAHRLEDLICLADHDLASAETYAQALLPLLLAQALWNGATLQRRGDARIARVLARIHRDFTTDLGSEDLAAEAGLGVVHLRNLFRAATGQTPKAYLIAMRLREAASRLRSGEETVRSIAQAVGYADEHHFHRAFREAYGCSAMHYRRGG